MSAPQHVSDRGLDLPVRELDLVAEAVALLQASPTVHTAKTLARQGPLRVVLLALPRGTRIPRHQAAAAISVQAIFGEVTFTVADQKQRLVPGKVLVVARDLAHDLEAAEDSAVLLTLAAG